jgi:hypothetical protein
MNGFIVFFLIVSSVTNNYCPLAKQEFAPSRLKDEEVLIFNAEKTSKYTSLPTVIFAENFTTSDFPPAGWELRQVNNDSIGNNPCFWSRFTSYFRSNPAACGLWWSYNPQDEWLISPPVSLTGSPTGYYYLRFWTYGYLGSPDSDHYYVKVSTDDGNNWEVVYDLSSESRGWNRYEEPIYIDLSTYAGQTIRIAWHADDGPANQGLNYVWFIDDIELGAPFEHDVGVAQLLEIKYRPLRVNEQDTFYLRISNFGGNDEFGISLKMMANDGLISELIVAINALSHLDTFFVWTPLDPGEYILKFFTELLGDQDNANDTLYLSAAVANEYYSIPYNKDFNEDWGPFGNNPPTDGWEIRDYGDETPKRWNRNDWFRGYLATLGRIGAVVRFQPVERQNEWLISPRFDCSMDTQYTLSFWHQYEGYKDAVPDTGYLLISTDGGNNWQVISKYAGGRSGVISWGYQNFNISDIVRGQNNVKIAFRYYAHNAGRWIIDDFTLIYTPNIDVSMIRIEAPSHISLFETLPVKAIIKNTGREVLNPHWYVTYAINEKLDSILVSTPINPQDSFGFTFSKIITEVDTYRITVHARYPNDEYPSNDLLSKDVFVSGWRELRSIPTLVEGRGVKDGAALVSFGDSIFAFRGCNSNEFYIYFPETDSWAPRKFIGYVLKPNGTPIRKNVKGGSALTLYQGKIYAFKGGNTQEFWRYTPALDSWTQLKDISKFWPGSDKPTKVKSGGALTTFYDSIYAFKGGNTCEFWLYIPELDSWVPRCPLITPTGKKIKGGGALVTCGDTIYAFVGGGTNYFYAYLPGEDTWIILKPPSFDNPLRPQKAKVKDGASLAVLNGKIYAFRGGNTRLFGYYQPIADTWYQLENIPGIKRVKSGGALVGAQGKIYAFKGGNTREFWVYTEPGISKNTVLLTRLIPQNTNVSRSGSVDLQVNQHFFIKITKNSLVVNFSAVNSELLVLKLYDASGKLIRTITPNTKSTSGGIKINNLSSGVYFLHCEPSKVKQRFKIILL